MGTQILERVIGVISKSSTMRSDPEIDFILPWLKKRTDLLKGVDRKSLIDLVRNCQYLRCKRDDVIIKQGDLGDRFYIMLTGKTSVYIDTVKSDDDPPPKMPPEEEDADGVKAILEELEREANENKKKPLNRAQFGKYIIKFEAGKSFGELALIQPESRRNASIIADEDTDLLVINRELFNRSLKEKQELEYVERRNFIENSPFFRFWNTKFKRLLEMSIRKEELPFDTVLVKQGQPIIGLHFILKGQARVVMEPSAHAHQYSRIYEENNVYAKELGKHFEKKNAKSKDTMQSDHIRVRRKDGYAAAERRISHKSVDMCFVQENEIIGDTELVLGMGTYMQTVVCSANTEVIILDNKNIERLIYKKNQMTMDMLRDEVEKKLKARYATPQGSHIELFKHLIDKIEDMKPKNLSRSVKVNLEEKEKEVTLRRMVNLFMGDRAPFMEPCVPGTTYYMHKSYQRTKRQELMKKREWEKRMNAELRLSKARKEKRQPRSRRELERLTQSAQVSVDRTKQLHEQLRKSTNLPMQTVYRSLTPPNPSPKANGQAITFDENGPNMQNGDTDEEIFKLTQSVFEKDKDQYVLEANDVNNDYMKQILTEMDGLQKVKTQNRTKIVCAMVDKQAASALEKANLPAHLRPKSAPVRMSSTGEEDVFDLETGETALRDLEDRILLFNHKYSTHQDSNRRLVAKVAEMKRYNVQNPNDIPLPGGTVFVKQKHCKYPPGSIVANHQHIRRFMIPKSALVAHMEKNQDSRNLELNETVNEKENTPAAQNTTAQRKIRPLSAKPTNGSTVSVKKVRPHTAAGRYAHAQS